MNLELILAQVINLKYLPRIIAPRTFRQDDAGSSSSWCVNAMQKLKSGGKLFPNSDILFV